MLKYYFISYFIPNYIVSNKTYFITTFIVKFKIFFVVIFAYFNIFYIEFYYF